MDEDRQIQPVNHQAATPQIEVYTPSVDDGLVDMWLHGHSPHTQDAYGRDVADFRAFCRKPLCEVT